MKRLLIDHTGDFFHLCIHPRKHGKNALDTAHLTHLVQTVEIIVETELGFAELLIHLRSFFLINSFLRLLDQAQDVAHSEDTACHTVRIELFEIRKFFTHSDVINRSARDSPDRQRRTASGIAVALREDHTVDSDFLRECLRNVDGFLSCHRVDDQDRGIHIDRSLDIAELLHHALVDLQTACRVDEDHIVAVLLRMRNSGFYDIDGILSVSHRKDRHTDFFTVHLQLFDRRRPVNVSRNEERALAVLLILSGELCRRRRLTCTLQTCHHEDRHAVRLNRDLLHVGPHELDHLLIDDLDDHLPGIQTAHDVLADRLRLNILRELLDDLEIDVRLKESHLDFLHGLVDIFLRQGSLGTEHLEYILQFFCKALKCHISEFLQYFFSELPDLLILRQLLDLVDFPFQRNELPHKAQLLFILSERLLRPTHHIVYALPADAQLLCDLAERQIVENDLLVYSSLMFCEQLSIEIIEERLRVYFFHECYYTAKQKGCQAIFLYRLKRFCAQPVSYSLRSASIGSSFAACTAGIAPKTTPTAMEKKNPTRIAQSGKTTSMSEM